MQATKRQCVVLLASSQQPVYLVDELDDVEGFVDEGVDARVFSGEAVVGLRASRRHQDRRRLQPEPASERSHYLDSASVREAHVDDDEVGLEASREHDPGFTVAGFDDAIAARLDSQPEQKAKTRIVLANENCGGSGQGDRNSYYL